MTPDEMNAALAQMLREKGWQPVWAHSEGGDVYVVKDTTGPAPYGQEGAQPAGWSLGFRPPPTVKIFDVDDYEDKHGMDTVKRAEAELGPLPPTWRVSARGDVNPSGRYLYRCPEDVEFNDSVFAPFGELETRVVKGKETAKVFTDVEVVRTRHRWSWAPGVVHYKNGEVIEVFDADGELSAMPSVDELPWLPESWTDYLRNPPRSQSSMQFRPDAAAFGEGLTWYLGVPDGTLSSRGQLCDFAWWMLISTRNDSELVKDQLRRVSVAVDPSDPWLDQDFRGMVDSNTQRKTGEYIARQDEEYLAMTGYDLPVVSSPPSPAPSWADNLASASEHVAEDKFTSSPPVDDEDDMSFYRQGFSSSAPPVTATPSAADDGKPVLLLPTYYKSMPDAYKNEFTRQAYNRQAKLDVEASVRLQQGMEWKARNSGAGGFTDPYDAPDPPSPETFTATGLPHPLVTPNTVTILYGNRASGKTWVAAAWAKQEVIEGNHVMWLDFERQASLMKTKLEALNVPRHLSKNQFHYSGGGLPPVDHLCDLISDYLAGTAAGGSKTCDRVLVVIDSFRDLLNAVVPTGDSNSGESIAKVYAEYLDFLHAAGATICLIDHAPKSNTDSTFGSERKESAADNVFKVEMKEKFVINHSGYSIITCTKDRYGVVPVGADGEPSPIYLWVPGDDDVVKGGGRNQYPKCPELRAWGPEPDFGLKDWDKSVSVGEAEVADIRSYFTEERTFGTTTEISHFLLGKDVDRKKWAVRDGKITPWKEGMKLWAGRRSGTKFKPHTADVIARSLPAKAREAGLEQDANGNWSWPDAPKPPPPAAGGTTSPQDVLAKMNTGSEED